MRVASSGTMTDYPNVHVLDHPLIRHKIARLRDGNTGTKEFRELITEIATLMAYEGFRDVITEKVMVRTPFEDVKQEVIADGSIVVVPILRAGLGMVEGVFRLFPTAKVGHIGLCRNEETLEPEEYYCKLPKDTGDKVVMVLDPMLATGGSASAAVSMLKEHGCRRIKFMAIIAAPEGVGRIASEHPDIEIFISTVDRCLNDRGYILPGLGDAGDRIFGTD